MIFTSGAVISDSASLLASPLSVAFGSLTVPANISSPATRPVSPATNSLSSSFADSLPVSAVSSNVLPAVKLSAPLKASLLTR